MSTYSSSYVPVPWSKGTSSYLSRNATSGSHASSAFDRSRPNYGSLPRSYGSTKPTTDRNASHVGESVVPPAPTRTSSSRFATRGLSVERSSDRAKSPEPKKYTPSETTALRIGSSSRFGSQIARSPISEKTPNVFGISPVSELPPSPFGRPAPRNETLHVVSRSTSPTPPCNSSFLRAKRADMERLESKQAKRASGKTTVSTEVQTEDPRKVSAWGGKLGSTATSTGPVYRGYLASNKKPVDDVKSDESAKPRVGGLSLATRPTELPLPKTNFAPFKLTKSSSSTGKPPTKSSYQKPVDSSSSDDSSSESSSESASSSSSKNCPASSGSASKFVSASHASTSHMSSADEASSLATDKPPKSPSKKEEAKTVVIKALAPVTPLKVKYGGSSGKSSEEDEKKTFKLRKFDSGDRAWWLESKDVSGTVGKSTEEPKSASRGFKLRKFDSGDTSAWLAESDKQAGVEIKNVPNGVNLKSSSSSPSPLQKTCSVSSVTSDEGSARLHRAKSSANINPSKKGSGGMQKTGSTLSVPSALKRSPSGSNPVAAKPPHASSPTSSRTDSIELLEAKEHTPGFNRLHQRLRFMRPLVRVESGERDWWLSDEEKAEANRKCRASEQLGRVFCGSFSNIDQLLGNQAPPPASFRTPENSSSESSDDDDQNWYREIAAHQVKVHDATAQSPVIQPAGMIQLDDTALQLYKDGDFGSYLDLDASINEQQEEFEGFNADRKNSIVLRTQLSVRVHTIIEKLLNCEGRELRRALFSLKQIFQEDKDLVHEFVQNDGLACLIKVGSDADQNYQNYILRALGQLMLYVDGMNGVIEHPATIQWLYNLMSSKFRLVVKTALKLLLVFVEYADSNCVLLVKAIKAVDYVHTTKPWSNIMKLMKEYDSADTELLIYAMTLINKTLNGLPDQDIYYDQVDAIEEQGIENVIRLYMSKQGTDLDLLRQFQIYEAVLQFEDGLEKGSPLRQLDETIRKALKKRKSLTTTLSPDERRKSRRFSNGKLPLTLTLTPTRVISPPRSPDILNDLNDATGLGVPPRGIRRRRERAERQKSFIREQCEVNLVRLNSSSSASSLGDNLSDDDNCNNGVDLDINKNCTNNAGHVTLDLTPTSKGINGHSEDAMDEKAPRREGAVRDLTQKIASNVGSPSDEAKNGGPFSDMRGIISKAKEELAKSQSRASLSGPLSPTSPPLTAPPVEIRKSEADLHWESLQENSTRPLVLCDLDFNDLGSDEEKDILAPAGVVGDIPPPPPPGPLVPPPQTSAPNPPPVFFKSSSPANNQNYNATSGTNKKTKKTVKLFWKEVRDDPIVMSKMGPHALLWDELSPVVIDTQRLEHLFESRSKDLISKKQLEMNKNKEIIALDHKRSSAINIGMTKLPPPRSIKTAILKMDATVMNREGIEKLLTMLPTEEERSKIQEAQAANPDLPLGSAEQFLLTLASISELEARLKLWAFKLDFEILEREIAEPLMDLKQGMECLRNNKTFRAILSTLLSIGIFLNGSEVKGFQIDYLAKVPEVKDTVHKHTLLHHLCHVVMEKFPDATDLYSEIGAVTRVSKVDFEDLAGNIVKMKQQCKASFDYLKAISKHDGTTNVKLKMSDFLADCAERIIVLDKVHRRVIHRFHKFCLWVGVPIHRVNSTKPNELCRIVSEFALEYRTTRERVLQQLEKKASHRERNKTRGKMITEVGKLKTQEDRKDAELKQLLGHKTDTKDSVMNGGSLPWRRGRKDILNISVVCDRVNGSLTDGDDEILESLVKTATKTPVSRAPQRDRKRNLNADRKSFRRTLRNGLTDEDRKHLAANIKGY